MSQDTQPQGCPLPLLQIETDPQLSAKPLHDPAPLPELAAQGWERRFMASPDRIQETVRLYTELGFEVHVETVKSAEFSDVCGDCRSLACSAYSTIYTRKPVA